MPETVTITNRPFWSRILAVFWLAEVATALAFAVSGFQRLGESENGAAWMMIIAGIVLGGVGVVLAAQSGRTALLKGTALEMSDGGLRDLRICDQVIAWPAIRWKIVFNGRSYSLQFDVAAPERARLQVYWEKRLLALFNRVFRYPEFTVAALGTGMSIYRLAEIMARFRPTN